MTLGNRMWWSVLHAVLPALVLCAPAGAATAVKARIVLHQAQGEAGSLVTGTGTGFDYWSLEKLPQRIGGEGKELEGVWTTPGPARIHWNHLEEAVVWEGSPGSDGKIEFSFQVPADTAPGKYTVVATQTGYDGKPSGGTPARATFRVVLPAFDATPVAPTVEPRRPAPSSGADARKRAGPRDAGTRKRVDRAPRPNARSPESAVSGAAGSATTAREGRAASSPRARRSTRSVRAAGRTDQKRLPRAVRSPAASAARPPAAPEREGLSWYLVVFLLAGGAGAGAVGTFMVTRKRRRDPGPVPSPAPAPRMDAPDAIDLELSELVEQERARERPPVLPL